jgi:hypothetical protein
LPFEFNLQRYITGTKKGFFGGGPCYFPEKDVVGLYYKLNPVDPLLA